MGWVNPPEKMIAGIQSKSTTMAVKMRPVSRIESGGSKSAST